MAKFFYRHFGNDVPRYIEQEYNKMLRREQYLEEREAEFRAQSADFDKVQEVMPDPESLPRNKFETARKKRYDARLEYLPAAMELLRMDFPEGYEIIVDYFYSNEKVTLSYLAAKHGTTMDIVRYRIRIAEKKLKEYIILHENKNE